jgi:3',5'-cyclic AMP phosphodiesterase CpdA
MIQIKWKTIVVVVLLFVLVSPGGMVAQQSHAVNQQYVEGIIYEDQNGNGQRDSGEPGLAEVPVSNQREVVLTDEDGHYRLPVEEQTVVFVTKPTGFEFPLNENNLPAFYYIHQPQGSPDGLKYPGVQPTGSLPDLVNFGLMKGGIEDRFTAIAFGDPQPRDQTELSYFRDDVVAEMVDLKADLSIVLGDIMFDDLSMYDRYNRIMRLMGMPVYNIVGNHDINYDSIEYDEDANRYAKETFKRFYGPRYYSYNYGQVHFMALDNIDYFEDPDEEGSGAYRGYLSDRQLEWIEQDLTHVPSDRLIVLMAHIPLFGWEGDEPYLNTMNREKLIGLLDEYPNVLFLCGHIHMNYHHFLGEKLGRRNPTPIHHIAASAASGTWWGGPKDEYGIPITTQRDGAPNGYHILQFEGNSYTERYKAAGFGADYQMRIETPESEVLSEQIDEAEITVNVFNGSERSTVEYRINESEWIKMDRVETGMSPFVQQLRERYADSHPDWISQVRTNHLWKAEFPDGVRTGTNKLTVRTRDMFGREFTRSKIIEIK